MGSGKKGILLLLLPLFAFTVAHKFYVSVTNVGYSEKDGSLQITMRIFIDDLEAVLKERYGVDTKLATDDETEVADELIEKYLRTKFLIEIDDEGATYDFLGKEYDNDLVICYLELTKVDLLEIQSITIQNEVLTDLFDEQQNIVHFKIKDKKRSFVLIKEHTKGMLKL